MPHPQRIVFARTSRLLVLLLVLAASGCQMMSGHASNNLGTGYFREGNYAAAQQMFRQAAIEMPENPDFHYNLAATMQRQGNFAAAEQVYRQALHIDPSHQPSYHGLAQMLVQQGRQAEASNIVNTWVATQPYSTASHIELAWLQQQEGNSYAAAQSLQTALKLEPNNPTALAQLGQIHQSNGQPELAVAYYQRSLQGNWRQPEVQTRLAELQKTTPNRNGTQIAMRGPQPGAFPQMPPAQVAFGWQPGGSPMPTPQMAWQPPQPQFAAFPGAPAPNFAAAPQPQFAAFPGAPAPNFAAAPQPPVMAPQVHTTWMPPQGQYLMPAPLQQGGPTPVAFPQPMSAGPTPTFATAPPNADPAHVPQLSAELPVVQPY